MTDGLPKSADPNPGSALQLNQRDLIDGLSWARLSPHDLVGDLPQPLSHHMGLWTDRLSERCPAAARQPWSTTILESRCGTWSIDTSAGKVCTPESRCSSNATVKVWCGTRAATGTAASANVPAATITASAATRICPRWLTKADKSDTC